MVAPNPHSGASQLVRHALQFQIHEGRVSGAGGASQQLFHLDEHQALHLHASRGRNDHQGRGGVHGEAVGQAVGARDAEVDHSRRQRRQPNAQQELPCDQKIPKVFKQRWNGT